jgi:hypothetical protein
MLENISGTNAATWRQKLAADIPSFKGSPASYFTHKVLQIIIC